MQTKRYGRIVWEWLSITGATAITTASVYFFLIPSQVPVGSVSSLAMVLSTVIPLPISALTMLLNVLLLLFGFLFIGREFGAKTVYTSLLMPVFLAVLEWVLPDFTSLTGDQFLDMIAFIFTVSIGLSMLFNRNASSGGLDIVAKFLNKYFHVELGRAMSLSGMCVALLAAFVYDGKTVILSVLGTYFSGLMLDHFIFGSNVKKRVCIISEKMEEIRAYILDNLRSGATIYQAVGAYNEQPRQEIITIVDKTEYRQLMDFLEKVDQNAFITVYAVNEVFYRPKIFGGERREPHK